MGLILIPIFHSILMRSCKNQRASLIGQWWWGDLCEPAMLCFVRASHLGKVYHKQLSRISQRPQNWCLGSQNLKAPSLKLGSQTPSSLRNLLCCLPPLIHLRSVMADGFGGGWSAAFLCLRYPGVMGFWTGLETDHRIFQTPATLTLDCLGN